MKEIQLLSIEAGPECNLAALHPKCPSAVRPRGGTVLSDGEILDLVLSAYCEHGFGGLVGWHYYNEPTLYLPRVLPLMERIRAAVPWSRFILWTNGTLPCPDPRLALFELVQVSNYSGEEAGLRRRFAAAGKVNVFTPRFDDRLAAPTGAARRQPCLRPFVELPVDYAGTAHLCCQDWEGAVELGGVRADGLGKILERRRAVLEKIAGPEMAADAPARCLGCSGRAAGLPCFDGTAREAAQAWLAGRESAAAAR